MTLRPSPPETCVWCGRPVPNHIAVEQYPAQPTCGRCIKRSGK